MPAITLYGANGRALQQDFPPKAAKMGVYRGRVRHIFDTVAIAAATEAASKIYMGRIPSHAYVLPASTVYFGAFGTAVTLDIGSDVEAAAVDKLATDIAVASAGNSPVLEAIAASAYVKPLWEQLGLASDPKRDLEIVATIATANVGAAATFLTWSILYSHD
jgi:hypothetical protein